MAENVSIKKKCKECKIDCDKKAGSCSSYKSLGIRLLYVFIAWAFLGLASGNGFFTALTLFAFPLAFDYWNVNPENKMRKIVNRTSRFINATWVTIGLIGTIGILTSTTLNNVQYIVFSKEYIIQSSFNMQQEYLFMFVLISVFMAAMDIAMESTVQERQMITKH